MLDWMRKLQSRGGRCWVVARMVATFSVAILSARPTMADPKTALAFGNNQTCLQGCAGISTQNLHQEVRTK